MNYAIANNRKYFMYCESGSMQIIDISETGVKFESRGEWLCNGKLTHKSLRECIESLNGYRKPIMYKGENINTWQPDVFISYNPYTGEYYQKYHLDDTLLKKYETA